MNLVKTCFAGACLLALGVVSHPVSAAESKKGGRVSASGKQIVEDPGTILASSSEAQRENKKYYAFVELVGFTPLASYGVGGGMYLSPNTIVDGAYTTGKYELFGVTISATTIAARYKQFYGNSFYWRVGGMIRKYEMDTTVLASALGASSVGVSGTAQSFGPDFGIGNQWQWDTFTLGCDWVGYFASVAGSASVQGNSGGNQTEYDSSKSSMEKLSKTGNLQLLRFYLGASF